MANHGTCGSNAATVLILIVLAAGLMPMPTSTQDPFWVNAARTIFAVAAYRMRNQEKRSLKGLLSFLLTSNLTELQGLLKKHRSGKRLSQKK